MFIRQFVYITSKEISLIPQNALWADQGYRRAAQIGLRSYIPSAKAVLLEGNNQ